MNITNTIEYHQEIPVCDCMNSNSSGCDCPCHNDNPFYNVGLKAKHHGLSLEQALAIEKEKAGKFLETATLEDRKNEWRRKMDYSAKNNVTCLFGVDNKELADALIEVIKEKESQGINAPIMIRAEASIERYLFSKMKSILKKK